MTELTFKKDDKTKFISEGSSLISKLIESGWVEEVIAEEVSKKEVKRGKARTTTSE